jgi:SAM-dependent methyltransferase
MGWGYQAESVFNFLLDASIFVKNGVILDAGAGHQRYKPFFSDSIYITQEHSAGIEFKKMNNLEYDLISPIDKKIPLKDECLDGILSTSVIEHLKNPNKFIKEANRVLKPGGKLFINVPFCYPEHETPFDFNRPTRFLIEYWLKESGFAKYIIMPSSSSIESVVSFFSMSFRQDYNNYKQILLANKFFKFILRMFIRLLFETIFLLMKIMKFFIDNGPHKNTDFPVGWIPSVPR